MIRKPRYLTGPRYHRVEFQPWEGGPDTVVTLNVRASLLKLAPSGSIAANNSTNNSDGKGSDDSGDSGDGDGAVSVESAVVIEDGMPAAARAGAAQDIAKEVPTDNWWGALTRRRSLRNVERSVRAVKEISTHGENPPTETEEEPPMAIEKPAVASEDSLTSAEELVVELEERSVEIRGRSEVGGQAHQEGDMEVDETEEEEEEVEEKLGSEADTADDEAVLKLMALPAEGEPLDDPMRPCFIPKGTKVVLKEAYKSKPRGVMVQGKDLIGKTVR